MSESRSILLENFLILYIYIYIYIYMSEFMKTVLKTLHQNSGHVFGMYRKCT